MTLAIGNIMKGWKIPPPPKREPDFWRNVYEMDSGRNWMSLEEVESAARNTTILGRLLYRLRIYLKKEPTP